jgi:protein ImuB
VFAVICVPNFALQSLLRREPELRERPMALIDAAGANLARTFVLECSRAAEAAGVSAGLTAPQAQARCRELVLKPRSRSAEQSATDILLQTACAFSPNIEDTAPGVCAIDLRGLNFDGASMPVAACDHTAQQSFEFFTEAGRDSVEMSSLRSLLFQDWAGKIISALRQVSLEAQVGVAATPDIALLAARAATPVLCIQNTAEFFRTLPIAALEPTPQALDVLRRWGIHTAGAFFDLGKEAIAERLDEEALHLFQRASTQTIRPLNIVAPADTFEEQMDFEARIETIEPLLFVLRRFVEQLATRISLTYRVVAELRLALVLESGASYERALKVPAPTANVETLFRMLHTHLENLRTDAPVQALRLAAIPVRAEGQQFSLFESALRDPNHFHETLARLTALLGTDRVGTPTPEATQRPDAIRMTMPEFGKGQSPAAASQISNAAALCLRRFRPPVHADVEIKNGEPAFISTLLASGRVKRARGPWCISGTWWDERRWSRQEWDVEMERGELYRLRHAEDGWLLEGVYD